LEKDSAEDLASPPSPPSSPSPPPPDIGNGAMSMYDALRESRDSQTSKNVDGVDVVEPLSAAGERSKAVLKQDEDDRVIGCSKCQWRASGCKCCKTYGGSEHPLNQPATKRWKNDRLIIPRSMYDAVLQLGGYKRVHKLNLWDGIRSILKLTPFPHTKYGAMSTSKAPCSTTLNSAYLHYFPRAKSGSRYAPFAFAKCEALIECHSTNINHKKCHICAKGNGNVILLLKNHSIHCQLYTECKHTKVHHCLNCSFESSSLEQIRLHMRTH
jgi:hypothetical protein